MRSKRRTTEAPIAAPMSELRSFVIFKTPLPRQTVQTTYEARGSERLVSGLRVETVNLSTMQH
jgi:hypothetical protein